MYNTIFTIIIPLYNAENILRNNLSNLYFDRDEVQYVFINDGSTDESELLLAEFCKSHKNAEYHTINHSGVSNARNYGIRYATGQYIMFCDVDDGYVSNTFEILKNEISEQSDIIIFGAEINNLSEIYRLGDIETQTRKYVKPHIMDAFFNEKGTQPYVWNCCYRSAYIIDNSLTFCEKLDLGEDMVFQFGAFMVADKISFISEKLYRYNFCTDSSANARYLENPTERIKKHFEIVKEIDSLYRKKNQNRDAQYAKWVLDFLFSDIMTLPKNERKSLMPQIKNLFNLIELNKFCKGFKNNLHRIVLINPFWQFIYKFYKIFIQ